MLSYTRGSLLLLAEEGSRIIGNERDMYARVVYWNLHVYCRINNSWCCAIFNQLPSAID